LRSRSRLPTSAIAAALSKKLNADGPLTADGIVAGDDHARAAVSVVLSSAAPPQLSGASAPARTSTRSAIACLEQTSSVRAWGVIELKKPDGQPMSALKARPW